MTVPLPSPKKEANRKRKAHRKSRRGCGNCKLRRVKCDETEPRCKKCIAFGVSCNYDPKSSDLLRSVDGAFTIEIPQKSPCSMNQTILGTINAPLSLQSTGSPRIDPVYQFNGQDLEVLSRFQSRTILTLGTDKTYRVYQSETMKLACSHPFVLHIVLTLTLMHDRYLSASPNTKQSTAEAFHWYRGTVLFNDILSKPIRHSDRDALWAAAAILGAIAASCVEAKTPEEAWPLKPTSSSDLDWLSLSEGKKEIWKIADPTRADSVFRALTYVLKDDINPTFSTGPELEALPSEFIKLYDLDAMSNTDNNPYHGAASILARLLNIECDSSTIMKFLSFLNHIHPEYKRLLHRKDPRALLLLAYWYAKVSKYQMWIWRRSFLECQAICLYLERCHGYETNIQNLLQFPKMMCGLDAR